MIPLLTRAYRQAYEIGAKGKELIMGFAKLTTRRRGSKWITAKALRKQLCG